MIHGTKMILVPQEMARALNGDLPQPPAPVGSYSAMDTEMNEILKNKNADDLTKWKQYSNVLQRYMAKVERTKNALMADFESDDDDNDGANVTKQSFLRTPKSPMRKAVTPKKKGVSPKISGSSTAKRATSKPKEKITKKSTESTDFMPKILSGLVSAGEKRVARGIFKTLNENEQVNVTKSGVLKLKRRNIGLLEPLIRYKVKGESGIEPEGWNQFTSLIGNIKTQARRKLSSTPAKQRQSTSVGNGQSWLTF